MASKNNEKPDTTSKKENKMTEEVLEKAEKAEKAEVKQNSEEVKEKSSEKTEEIKTSSEIEDLKVQLNTANDRYLRLMAEYDNFRKRSAKEKLESYSDATAKALTNILPVYDNFERALEAETTDSNFKKGVEMIFKQFTDVLTKLGIEPINPLGETFNPDIAQAINHIEDETLGADTVAQVLQKGYKMGEKIIRYAMVVVAN